MEPTIEFHYTIKFYDTIRKKWQRSRDKMTEEAAARRYAHTQWEIIPQTKVERKIGGDTAALSFSHFLRNWNG